MTRAHANGAVSPPSRIGRIAFALFVACCRPSLALNPSLDISQYAHTSWTIREGFFKGLILSMAQSPDGYLWLGTEFGLLRFDGVRPVEWTPPGAEQLPSRTIRKLLAGRDGTLWMGTSAGLASWNGSGLTPHPGCGGAAVTAILEDREGTVWAGAAGAVNSGAPGRLCAIRGGKAQCWGQGGSLGAGVLSLYEDSRGNIWAGTDSGLWRWKPGPPEHYAIPGRDIQALIPNEDGQLLIVTPNGVRRPENGKALPYPVRGNVNLRRMIRDQHKALWIGTAGYGLIHLHQGRTDSFSRLDGLSADNVLSIFEDREGSIWVSTHQGLDRFHEFSVVTHSEKQGLSGDSVFSVLAARDGSVWLSGRNGLDRWKDGQATTFRKADGLPDGGPHSLFEDDGGRIWAFSLHGCAYYEDGRFVTLRDVPGGYVASIAGHANHLWVSQDRRLLHLLDGRVVEQIPWSDPGRRRGASVIVADRDRGGIWLGFWAGGLDYFKDGQVRRSYSGKDGLGEGRISDLRIEADNTIWAATDKGLSVIKHGRIATLASKNGLPCEEVYWSMEAADRSTWLYMPCGLARIARTDLEAWISDSIRKIPMTVLDGSDGVTAHVAPGGSWPRVAKSNDGRIWFVSFNGVISVLDPAHLPFNRLPPPVHIERIVVDDKPYELRPGMRLPANVRNLRIDYTALSLVAPEKVHFKYKLEGQNRNWHEVINERQATYTNLGPRDYRFRVTASNNSGVWNQTGDTLEFSIAPAYYQTSWFYASCVAAFLAMLWGLYRLRLYQIRREFNAQLDGRVEERMRVARELHDTMLQSFQAALIQMQAARNIFARRPEKTEESLDKAINTAAGAIAEGRSAIQDLRVHPASGGDLAQLLTAAGQELAQSEAQGNPPVFHVTVEGARQDLDPLLQDEVYRIARELLRNAFRHAQSGQIEAEIRYESRQLRVHIRDDGKGIEPEILKAGGRAGHWGLPGMRERANRFGGKLEFWSEAGAGTEAVLTVPAAVAFGSSNGGLFSFFRRKKAGA